MRTEYLKELGLDERQIAAVMKENGKDIRGIKERFSGYDQLREQADRLEQAGVSAEAMEALRQEISHWKEKAREAEKTWKEKLEQKDYDAAMAAALKRAGVRSEKAVRALLEEETISLLDTGELEGLEEQLETLRTEHGYLFAAQNPPPRILRPGNSFFDSGEDGRIRQAMGLPALD